MPFGAFDKWWEESKMKHVRKLQLLALGVALQAAGMAQSGAQEKVNFEDHVKPIFRDKCFTCHNTNKKSSDLDLSSYSSMMQGGASGAAIQPGESGASYLYSLVAHESEPFMPPNSERLPDAALATIKAWIDSGAPETSTSKVMLPKKPAASLTVEVAAGVRPEGPVPMPDVLNLAPVVHTGTTTAVTAIATSPWAKLVAVAGQKQVILYHSETLDPLGVLAFPEGEARVLKFSRNGALLLAGGGHGASKGLAVVWNVKTGERVMEVGDELDEVLAADISADQTLVALGGPGKVVRVYSTATNELAYEIKKHTDWIYALEFSPDSVLLATSDRNGGLHVWESHTGREYLTLAGHTAAVNSVSWRIDGNVLASGSQDTTIKLWEMENGNQIKNWGAHGAGVFSVEFCRDGRIVSSGRDKVAKLWDQNGTAIRQFEAFNDLALTATHCDETDRVIAGDWTGEVRIWNAADGARIGTLSPNPPLLEERVAQAEALVAPAQAKLAEVQTAHQAAVAAQTAQQVKSDAAAKALADAQKLAADQLALVTATEQKLAAEAAKEKTLTDSVTALQKAVPEIKLAAEKAAGVAEIMQSDEELKKLAAQLAAQAAARAELLAKHETELTTSKAAVVQITADVATAKQQLQTYDLSVVTSKATADAEAAAVAPLAQASAAAEALVAAAQTEFGRVNSLVGRWKNYIALRDELASLKAAQTVMDETQLKSLEAEALVQEKQTGIAASQKVMTDSQAVITQADQTLRTLTTDLATVEKQQADQAATIKKNEEVQPMLKMALEQTRAALALLPEDAEVKASADGLAAVADRQEKALVTMKEQLAVMAQTMQKVQADMKATSESMAAAQVQMTQAQEMIAKLTAEAAPLQQQAAVSKEELAKAEQAVQQAEQVVEARRQQIRPHLQLSQASVN